MDDTQRGNGQLDRSQTALIDELLGMVSTAQSITRQALDRGADDLRYWSRWVYTLTFAVLPIFLLGLLIGEHRG